jgi:transposase
MVRPVCAGCEQRDREIERLKLRIAALESENQRLRRELDESRRQAHRQTHPFRRRQHAAKPKKPGRRKGHKAECRPLPPPERIDRVVIVPCARCPDCGSELTDPGLVVQYQTDLPPIVPIVTQFNIETGYCPCCRQRCQGRHGEQTSDATGAAGNTIGPVALTMAAELKHRLGVPYRKICDFFATYCDLSVCPATLVRAEQRLTNLARPTFELLLDALRRSDIVHADETGWRIGRLNAWLWVFSNPKVTIYAIRGGPGSRSHSVPEEILGPDFDGFLIVDGFAAYTVLEYHKAQCNGHILRRAKNLCEVVPSTERQYLDELTQLIQEAIRLAQRREELTETGYARRVAEIEQRFVAWVMAKPASSSDELRRLHGHICKHATEWLVFLHEPAVPPTNNHAEQMLRPAVPIRKIGGCNKGLWGALVHSTLTSIMVTCKQNGKRFLDVARCLWRMRNWQPAPIAILPPPPDG